MAEGFVALATEAAEALDSDIIILNSPLLRGLDDRIIQTVRKRNRKSKAILILVTSGGDANAAYRIARCFQSKYDEGFSAVVSGYCKSAGTLLAVGATELYMGDLSELGPLDVQLRKKDEIGEYSSGLTVNAAMEAIREVEFKVWEFFMLQAIAKSDNALSFKTAAEIATPLALGVIQPIVAKVEVDRIGEDRRAMNIGREYAERLNRKSENLKIFDGSIDFVLEMLTSGYSSHGFVIDTEEAEALFVRVEPYPEALVPVLRALGSRALYPLGDDDPSAGVFGYLNGETVHANTGEQESAPDAGGGEFGAEGNDSPEDGGAPGGVRGDLPESP